MPHLSNITFACNDPARLAAFWAAAIGYEVEPVPPAIQEAIERDGLDPNMAAGASDPTGNGPRLFFEKKMAGRAGHMPIHLDIHSDDREADCERLVALGATLVEARSQAFGEYTLTWLYMKDPEGNGFCLH